MNKDKQKNFLSFGVTVDYSEEAKNARRVRQTVTPLGSYGALVKTAPATSTASLGKITGQIELDIMPEHRRGSFVMVEVNGEVGWLDTTLVDIPDWDKDRDTILNKQEQEPEIENALAGEQEEKPASKSKAKRASKASNGEEE